VIWISGNRKSALSNAELLFMCQVPIKRYAKKRSPEVVLTCIALMGWTTIGYLYPNDTF